MQLQHTELIVNKMMMMTALLLLLLITMMMKMKMKMITCWQNLQLLKKRTICSSLTGWNLNQTVGEWISYDNIVVMHMLVSWARSLYENVQWNFISECGRFQWEQGYSKRYAVKVMKL